jgi:hypothetical protein
VRWCARRITPTSRRTQCSKPQRSASSRKPCGNIPARDRCDRAGCVRHRQRSRRSLGNAHLARVRRALPAADGDGGEKLVEKHAKAAGLGDVTASYLVLDGGNVINDAMLSGALDVASIGVAGFLTLWAKAKDNPALEIRGLSE